MNADGREPTWRQTRILSFRNRQRTRALNTALLRRIIRQAVVNDFQVSDYELGLHLVEPCEMARINQQFLQHEGSTDVITFDHGSSAGQLHGEIFICIADAVKQAREFKTTWQSELVRYVIHGLLHLRGFDDLRPDKRREMKREENRLVRNIETTFPIRNLARPRGSQTKTRNSR